MSELKILVADDHNVIFDGVQAMLKNTLVVTALQYVASVEAIKKALMAGAFDLLILDLNINGINSLDYVSDFLQLSKHTKILVFTSYNNKKFIIKAKEAGVLGYLVKNTDQEQFCGVVKKLLAGGTYFPIRGTADYKSQIDHPHRHHKLEGVSERENEIISLLQDGNSDNEIADVLFISYNTVRTHKRNIFQKLGVHSNNGLIKFLQQKHMEF